MTLQQLRSFVAVADTGSVRAAAARLVVTQPAVSASLRALRDALGVPLVEPDGRGVRLTPAGRTFAQYARQVLGLLDEGRRAVAGSNDPARGALRVAAVPTASEHVLPGALLRFRQRFPDVDVALEVGTRAHVWASMDAHQADVALGGRPPVGSGLVTRALRPNDLVVVAAPELAVAAASERPELADASTNELPEPAPSAGTLAGPQLGRWTWLLRERGSGTRATMEAFLAGHQADPPTLTLGSNGAVVAGAAAGLGLTLISRDAVRRELADGTLRVVAVAGTPMPRPWHVVTQARMTPTTTLFVDHLLGPHGARAGPQFSRPEDATADPPAPD